MAKRILILGKSGQLGRALSNHLGKYAYSVGKEQLDFSKPENVANTLIAIEKEHGPFGAVINAMAYTKVDQAEDEPELARAMNALSPFQAAKWARAQDIPFVHVSSDYVYGRNDTSWIFAGDECKPECVYGATKLEGDQLLGTLANQDAKLNRIATIRTSWVYDEAGDNFPNKIKNTLKHAHKKF